MPLVRVKGSVELLDGFEGQSNIRSYLVKIYWRQQINLFGLSIQVTGVN